jgi:hypothetical protein
VGLSCLINREPGPNCRAAGALAWWGCSTAISGSGDDDRGVWMTQLLPFEDLDAMAVFGALERGMYCHQNLRSRPRYI